MNSSGPEISTHSEIRDLLLRLLFHEQKNMLTVLVGRSALSEDKLQSAFYKDLTAPGSSHVLSQTVSWDTSAQQCVDFSLSSHRVSLQYAQEMSALNDRCRKLLLDNDELWSPSEFTEVISWWCTKLSLEIQRYGAFLQTVQSGHFNSELQRLGVDSLTSSGVLSFLCSLHSFSEQEISTVTPELQWSHNVLKIKGF